MITGLVSVGIAFALCAGWHKRWGDAISGRQPK